MIKVSDLFIALVSRTAKACYKAKYIIKYFLLLRISIQVLDNFRLRSDPFTHIIDIVTESDIVVQKSIRLCYFIYVCVTLFFE